jgi:uncharacterized RDD family membrane protein YckC
MNNTSAPLQLRFLALLIDFVIILSYVGILAGVTISFYYFVMGGIPTMSTNISHIIGFLSLTVPVVSYFIFFEISRNQGTYGKQITGLKVISTKNDSLVIRQVIVRNIIKFLPWEYAHILVYVLLTVRDTDPSRLLFSGLIIANIIPVVYVCFVVIRKDHRAPHDIVSGTHVVTK